jgi:Uma2 family endonuclease
MTQSMRRTLPRYTYDEYAAMPDDGRRRELIDGELEVNPASSSRHQTVSRRLQFELMQQLEESNLALVFNAPIDVILSKHDVLQPDLAIIGAARQHIVSERGIEGPPDVVVEIISPSTRTLDRRVKIVTYARFGVPEYWLVDPELGHIELYRSNGGVFELAMRFDRASTLTTETFPELAVDLSRAFRP